MSHWGVRVVGLSWVAASFGMAQPAPVFEASTRLGLVDVSVTDLKNKIPIPRLSAEDFVLRDSGVQAPIRVFGAASTHLDIVLIVDTSGGTGRMERMNDISTPVRAVLSELEIEDHIGVLSVNADVTTHAPLSGQAQGVNAAREALNKQVDRGVPAQLLAAITTAAGMFKGPRTEERRRVIFLVTHNVQVAKAKELELAASTVSRADATVVGVVVPFLRRTTSGGSSRGFGIGLPIPGGMKTIQKKVKVTETVLPEGGAVDALVEATGGELIHPIDVPFEISTLFHRLRARYLLGFYAGETKGFHPIEVELSPTARAREGTVEIRHREGYWQ